MARQTGRHKKKPADVIPSLSQLDAGTCVISCFCDALCQGWCRLLLLVFFTLLCGWLLPLHPKEIMQKTCPTRQRKNSGRAVSKVRAECSTSNRLRWRIQYLRNAIDACSLMDMKKRQAEQRRSCKRKKHDQEPVTRFVKLCS